MSVEKFLDELKFLLSDIPEEEREEAIDFYRCYFEDAGKENEAAVIAELGSPEKVAYSIREGLKAKEDEGEYTETGYRTYEDINAPATRYAHKEADADKNSADEYSYYDGSQMSAEERYKKRYAKPKKGEAKHEKGKANQTKTDGSAKKKEHKMPAPLYVVGQIFLGILKVLMVIATVCIVILLIAALVALIAITFTSLGITVGFLVVGITMLVTGAGLVGAALIGIAFILFAVFLLFLMALVAFCKKGLAGGIRGITNTASNVVLGKKKKEA